MYCFRSSTSTLLCMIGMCFRQMRLKSRFAIDHSQSGPMISIKKFNNKLTNFELTTLKKMDLWMGYGKFGLEIAI